MSDNLEGRRIQGGPLLPVVVVNPVETGGDEAGTLQFDKTTGALITMDLFHHEVHEGETFHAFYKPADASPVADNSAINIWISVPPGREFHFVWESACGGEHERELQEGPIVSGGASFIPFNLKRSAGGSVASVKTNVTINTPGTTLDNQMVPGGTTGQRSGGIGAVRQGAEWILRGGYSYLVKATNRSGGVAQMSINAVWYEETE